MVYRPYNGTPPYERTIMFFRFLGRMYFYLVLVPYVWRYLEPVLTDVFKEVVRKQYARMTAEEKRRFEKLAPKTMPFINE